MFGLIMSVLFAAWFLLAAFFGLVGILDVLVSHAVPSGEERELLESGKIRILSTRGAGAPSVCQVCGEAIRGDHVACMKCDTPHHLDCWQYTGQCSTYGCGSEWCIASNRCHTRHLCRANPAWWPRVPRRRRLVS